MSPSGGSSPRTPWDDIPEPDPFPVGIDRPVVPEYLAREEPDDFAQVEADRFTVVEPDDVAQVEADRFTVVEPDYFAEVEANYLAHVEADRFTVVEPDYFAHVEPDYFAHVEPGATVEEEPKRRGRRRTVIEFAVVLLVAALVAVGLRAFVFEAFSVPSTSMLPTIQPGDRILVDRLFFHPSSLQTGDIIVFHTPPAAKTRCDTTDPDLVKRVIGLPGDSIYSVDNTIYIDRAPLAQPFLKAGTALGPAIGSPSHPVVVPKDDYFVLGDNRDISCDSRYFGFVQAKAIVGRVIALIWRNNHPAIHAY